MSASHEIGLHGPKGRSPPGEQDHLHAVIAMRDGAGNYPRSWQDIKKGFTRRVQNAGIPSPWQARYWEHTLRDEEDLRRHVDYVHINPVKHGLVTRVADWPYSSFRRYARSGLLPADWAGGGVAMKTGERV